MNENENEDDNDNDNEDEDLLWQPVITKTNSSMTSKSLSRISSGNYKRTQQEVPTVFLCYLYRILMVHTNNK